MGFVSLIQGGALQDRYRALLLVRWPVGNMRVHAATAQGITTERFQLAPAGAAPLDGLLKERKLSTYLFEATNLKPGRDYRFLFTDGQNTSVPLDTYTLPAALPAEGMTVAVGTCFFDDFDMSARIETVLRRPWLGRRPLVQFWGGDNLYVDVPTFGFSSGNKPYVQTLDRYLRYFDATGYMRARAATPNYTTYDDHEFWNNFPEPQPHLSRDDDDQRGGYTFASWACLDLFQSSLNPSPQPPLFAPLQDPGRPARSFQFDLPPLSFFFADLRSNRDRQRAGARMMATRDLQALVAWARTLRGPGVLVLGQPLWIGSGGKTDFNPPAFAQEYQAIWAALRAAPFDVLVVSGDVHHSRVLAFSLANAPHRSVYEFVTSPASHIPTEITSVLPSFLFAQGQGSASAPAAVENSGQGVKASCYFGTTVQNTIGFLGFVPKPDQAVEVSAMFVEYGGHAWPSVAKAEPTRLPAVGPSFERCDGGGRPLFTLRRRPLSA